jgi:hypothetical protein
VLITFKTKIDNHSFISFLKYAADSNGPADLRSLFAVDNLNSNRIIILMLLTFKTCRFKHASNWSLRPYK